MDSQIFYHFCYIGRLLIFSKALTYLSVALWDNPRDLSFWDLVVCKISKHLNSWEGAFLSLRIRITRTQSCFSSIPLYCFDILVAVVQRIEIIMWDFLWSEWEI